MNNVKMIYHPVRIRLGYFTALLGAFVATWLLVFLALYCSWQLALVFLAYLT